MTMVDCGLAIFVKTPALSAVKTRLWPRIGQRCAEAFHLASAEAVASVAQQAQHKAPITAYWAVAELQALQSETWSDLHKLAQGEGSLGARMHYVYDRLLQLHPAALLIGADAPQITSDHLLRAAHWLSDREPRLVIGRARDGGFWLFGGNVGLPESAWTRIAYSRPDTAARFVQAMHLHGRFLDVGTLADVDEYDDIARVLGSLETLTDPTPAQGRLAAWMHDVVLRKGVCP